MWIRTVEPSEATGEVAELYAGVARTDGGVDNIVKAHGRSPAALRALPTFCHGVMHDDAILEINPITDFFAWCTRTAQGLGIELERDP